MLARDSVFNETLRIIVWSPHKLLTLGREMTSKITAKKRNKTRDMPHSRLSPPISFTNLFSVMKKSLSQHTCGTRFPVRNQKGEMLIFSQRNCLKHSITNKCLFEDIL